MSLFGAGQCLRMDFLGWFRKAEQQNPGQGVDKSKLGMLGSAHTSEFLSKLFECSGDSLFRCVECSFAAFKLIGNRCANQCRSRRIPSSTSFPGQPLLDRIWQSGRRLAHLRPAPLY